MQAPGLPRIRLRTVFFLILAKPQTLENLISMCGNPEAEHVMFFYKPIKALQNSPFTSENGQEPVGQTDLNFWDFGNPLGVGGRISGSKTPKTRQN